MLTRLCRLPVFLLAFIHPAIAGEVGPRLAEPEFFSLLDLERPELSAVRDAVAHTDWPAARHALAGYFRHRTRPRWVVDPHAIGGDPRYRDPAAEKALAHRLGSIGIEWQFGTNIDWAFNPTAQPGSQWPVNHEWTWQLNRHAHWLALARAFHATGDERYAREFVAQLRSWISTCPVPVARADNRAFSRWRTIEAGIRTGSVWPEIFPRVLAAKSFEDESLVLMLQSFVEHAQYLLQFHSRGNWLTMEANGLYHVGALFPEFKDAARWRETAAGRLLRELDAQVYPDGAQMELAPGYHGVALRNFLGPLRLVARTGFELPPGYVPKLEKMFDYLLLSMQPDYRMPPLNDSGAGSIQSYLEEAARLFPGRDEFPWAASAGRRGRPPAQTSHAFPYAGQFFMRSGWDPEAVWLCFEGGPFGLGHQHEDKLSVMLTAFGMPLLIEGGTYTYDASEWRRYVLSSRAHNVLLVDGLEQNRRRLSPETFVVKSPLPHIWESSADFDHAAARYDEGWGKDGLPVATHTRHVFFLKPGCFVILDRLQPADNRPHTYEALFHLNSSAAEVEGLRVTTLNRGANLEVAAFGAQDVRIVQGQKEPVVQGWSPDSSAGYGGVRPIPTAVFRATATGPATLLFSLYPLRAETKSPLASLQLAGDELTVRFKDGRVRRLKVKPVPDKP